MPRRAPWIVLAVAVMAMLALASGVAGGLVRAGAGMPAALAGSWLTAAVGAHAFLMVCAFLGTVIGLERAVALKTPAAFAGPLASALGGVAALLGHDAEARGLAGLASLLFVYVNLRIVAMQRATHTVLLLVGALAWSVGCMLYLAHAPADAVVPWWFSFLVLTIAAERLEMARLMRHRAGAAQMLNALLLAMLCGAALSAPWPMAGGLVFGLSLCGLAAWLLSNDIARRTLRAQGLSRYMAACLLGGYAWLFVAGLAWAATAGGLPLRDVALHALALGFVFSMMLGHAPVILPAIARVKVAYGRAFYLPLALLHGSLIVRLGGGSFDPHWLAQGAAGNAVALLAFVATIAVAAMTWRLRHRHRHRHPVPGTP